MLAVIERALPAQRSLRVPVAGSARRAKARTRAVGVVLCRDGLSDGMRRKIQPRLSPHALSNSAEATSTVSRGQAIASSSGFVVGAADPANPFTNIHRG